MKVFISADIEGCCGVFSNIETHKNEAVYAPFAKQMTKEVLAVCEAAHEAGADEIVVKDGHGDASNIDPLQMPSYVTLIRGKSGHPYNMTVSYTHLDVYKRQNRDITVQYDRLDGETGKWESHEAFLDADLFTLQNGRYLTGIQFSGYESLGFNIPKIIKYGAAEVRYAVLTVVDSLKELVKGRISADDIAGPVRIVSIIDNTVDQVRPYGLVTVFMNILNLMVMFSANLGVMNLLPFPALDGGRLVFLAYELAAKKPVDQRIEGAVNMAGMALLMAFMAVSYTHLQRKRISGNSWR